MSLKFPGMWRFKPPQDGRFINQSIPSAVVEEFITLILKLTNQGERQTIIEHFKRYFCEACGSSYNWSSSASWAETDLWTYAQEAAVNAPLFISAFYDACFSLGEKDSFWAPDAEIINEVLTKHNIGYMIKPPQLEMREDVALVVEVPIPPPTLAERAIDIFQTSLKRSEELLLQGRGREAVQESLWLLETVTTAFRGVETATGSVEGKYFNQIVRDLRKVDSSGKLKNVLDWITTLHGYLSSPTGGGIRHGLDLDEGVQISENEARLFCNLIRSYLSFLIVEHQRLANRQ